VSDSRRSFLFPFISCLLSCLPLHGLTRFSFKYCFPWVFVHTCIIYSSCGLNQQLYAVRVVPCSREACVTRCDITDCKNVSTTHYLWVCAPKTSNLLVSTKVSSNVGLKPSRPAMEHRQSRVPRPPCASATHAHTPEKSTVWSLLQEALRRNRRAPRH
jgi:hypothetical protein